MTRFRKGLYTEVETIGFDEGYSTISRVLSMILDVTNPPLVQLKLDR